MRIQSTTIKQNPPAFKQKFLVTGEDVWSTHKYAQILKDYLFALREDTIHVCSDNIFKNKILITSDTTTGEFLEKLTSLTSQDISVRELKPKKTQLIDDYATDAVPVGKETIEIITNFLKTTLKIISPNNP